MVHFISRYLFYAQKNNQSIQICAYTHRKNALIEIMCATAFRDLLISALEIVPPEITLHRISGDAPRATLIAPEWSYKKRTILNTIHREMRVRNTWQGRLV